MGVFDNDRRLRVQYPGALYHLSSSGVQRSRIYLDEHEQARLDRLSTDGVNRCSRGALYI